MTPDVHFMEESMTLPRKRVIGASMVSTLTGAVLVLVAGLSSPPPARAADPVTVETLFQWMVKYSNWGRWGPDDQLGTLNFITERTRRDAARQVRLGISVGTARRPYKIAFDTQQPFIPATPSLAPKPTGPLDLDDPNPFFFYAVPPTYTSDRWNFAMASAVHTHLDSICHTPTPPSATPRLYPERMVYNGLPLKAVATPNGCARYGMEIVGDMGIFTRGILFDATLLPNLREGGNPWLAPGTRVQRADLEALERIEGVRVGTGDVILLYTGRWKRRAALGPWATFCTGANRPPNCGFAGYWYDNIPFFYERQVAQFGADAWNDVTPTDGLDDYTSLPYHGFQAAMGIAHYDNLDLEALEVLVNRLHRYEFLFTTNTFPVVGGITSPLNPLAVF
jgi:hypothetical protein